MGGGCIRHRTVEYVTLKLGGTLVTSTFFDKFDQFMESGTFEVPYWNDIARVQ